MSLGVVPSIWRVEVLRMLSPPAQEAVAVAGEDGGELKVKPVPLLLIPTPLLDMRKRQTPHELTDAWGRRGRTRAPRYIIMTGSVSEEE